MLDNGSPLGGGVQLLQSKYGTLHLRVHRRPNLIVSKVSTMITVVGVIITFSAIPIIINKQEEKALWTSVEGYGSVYDIKGTTGMGLNMGMVYTNESGCIYS